MKFSQSPRNSDHLRSIPIIRSWLPVLFAFAITLSGYSLLAQTEGKRGERDSRWDSMLAKIEKRIEDDPTHSDSWRLLAKIRDKQGDVTAARKALERAISLNKTNVAAHFDLGRLLDSVKETHQADHHFARVIFLAPHSQYARQLLEKLASERIERLQHEAAELVNEQSAEVMQVGYEIQTFDGRDFFRRELLRIENETIDTISPWRTTVTAGVLYNSNIALTPISRAFSAQQVSSAQAFINPELEYIWFDRGSLQSGPIGRGYFAFNEGSQSEFNLASFQGGWFAERPALNFAKTWDGRLEYLYSLDLQDRSRFAFQHALTVSASSINRAGRLRYLYATFNHANFMDDGVIPNIDSLDGFSFITGFVNYIPVSFGYVDQIRWGGNASATNADGADNRFAGAGLNSALNWRWDQNTTLETEFAFGFRDYYDFTDTIERDETIWRLGLRFKRRINDQWSWSLVTSYDRFASDNEAFDTDRTEAGIICTYLRM